MRGVSRRRPLLWLAVLVVLAVQLAIAGLEGMEPGRPPLGDEVLYQRAALQLLETGSTDLSPLWPPLYIFFLAALFALGQGTWWLVPCVQGGLLLLSAWLLRRLARHLLGDVPEINVAPLLLLAYPPMVAFGYYFWPEVLHLTLMLGAVAILLRPRRSVPWMLGYGALLGAAVASKALLTPWLPVLVLAVGWPSTSVVAKPEGRSPWQRLAWRPAIWASLGLALVTLPLMAWNAQRVGVFTLSDSAAFNLWVGLEDTSDRSFVDAIAGREYRTFLASGDDFLARQAVLRQKIGQKLADEGVLPVLKNQLQKQYRRLLHRDTYFTDQLPGGALAEGRRGYPVMPNPRVALARGLSYALYAGILALAGLGMVVTVPRQRPWLWAVIAFLAYNLVIFLALHVKSRYRIQMMPWLILFATCGWVWCRHRLAGWQLPGVLRPPARGTWPSRRRWAAGIVGTSLALYLAMTP